MLVESLRLSLGSREDVWLYGTGSADSERVTERQRPAEVARPRGLDRSMGRMGYDRRLSYTITAVRNSILHAIANDIIMPANEVRYSCDRLQN